MKFNTEKIDPLFYGRVLPKIYSFSIDEIKNALKIGDTYRTVDQRISEWKDVFKTLHLEGAWEAVVDENVYFRDYSVHQYLRKIHKHNLSKTDFPSELKDVYSKEFFDSTNTEDIENAISDILEAYHNGTNEYAFYDSKTRFPTSTKGDNSEEWEPRPNQKEVIDNFKKAVSKGRKNLLMYAVMRFGKSYTSMCCAETLHNCKFVVIVSGKADVASEWENTITKPKQFKDYLFLTSKELKADPSIINKVLSGVETKKKVAVFLTLQDLAGNNTEAKFIKTHHKEIFKNKIDLLLIDETHYGARAEKYGVSIKETASKEEIKKYDSDKKTAIDDDSVTVEDAIDQIKKNKFLKFDIKLHLSGTPYRILMSTEFKDIDIIARCSFSDIVEAKLKWDLDPANIDKEEWENPYFGFPQMIRFAFNPSDKAYKKMLEMKKRGIKYTLSTIFEPRSIKKDTVNFDHKKFKYEEEVIELIKSVDGTNEDSNVFPFLDYEKITKGKMCNHIVMVLPYCASCDAMEELLLNHKEELKNLSSYEIVNISGVDGRKTYRNPDAIKSTIETFEKANKKTITLTVNRMLTGSTVKEWDTMVYLKNTTSPQEYDQAVFRLQNPYVTKSGSIKDKKEISINMKPQTLLVDFDPDRLFKLQQLKSLVYNSNQAEKGNKALAKRLEIETKISPIICVNLDKMVMVEPNNIIEILSNYSKDKGVSQEAESIPVDDSLFKNKKINGFISQQGELHSKTGLSIKKDKENGVGDDIEDETSGGKTTTGKTSESATKIDTELLSFRRKFKMYYARILFFAFLTNDKVASLDDIISVLGKSENQRIASNLLLVKGDLVAIRNNLYSMFLKQLDDKILNLNILSNDTTLTPIERSTNALARFDVMSPTEHVTPTETCIDMISAIEKQKIIEIIKSGGKVLDLSSKCGEFTLAMIKLIAGELDVSVYKDSFYSIPTSSHAYEFTRKIYSNLNLNINNVSSFFAESLLDIKNASGVDYNQIAKIITQNKQFNKIKLNGVIKGGIKMKFDIIVGNPPYQLEGGSGGNNDAAIFQHFVELSNVLKPQFSSFIIPSRWFAAGRENLLGSFRKQMLNSKKIKNMVVYSDASKVFKNVDIKGGVCYFLIDESYNGLCHYKLYRDSEVFECDRKLNEFNILIREPKLAEIVKKVLSKTSKSDSTVDEIISSDTPFGISSNPKTSKKNPIKVSATKTSTFDTLLYHIENGKRKIEYCSSKNISKNTVDISKYKVLIPGSYGAGETFPHQILSVPVCADKNSVCSQSYLYAAFNSKDECENFVKYLKTRFFRALVLAVKITQSAPNKVYQFVPNLDYSSSSDIDWNKDIADIEAQLYAKYEIDDEQIEYINSMIRIMGDEDE